MQRGITLIELLVCIAIVGVMTGFGLPGARHLIERSEATAAINWVVVAVNYTRHAAITYRTTTTLCPSRDGKNCGGKFHDGALIFLDRDQDRILDDDDTVLRRLTFPVEGGVLHWRAFRNRQYLQMVSSGFTNFQNGNFVYCPPGNDLRYARQVVINLQGRARSSRDTDGDGYIEDRRGRHLRC